MRRSEGGSFCAGPGKVDLPDELSHCFSAGMRIAAPARNDALIYRLVFARFVYEHILPSEHEGIS